MIDFLKKHWLFIGAVSCIIGYAIYVFINVIKHFSATDLGRAGLKMLLFAIMVCLVAWLVDYFRNHRKVKTKDV
jgi:hypothetical protein